MLIFMDMITDFIRIKLTKNVRLCVHNCVIVQDFSILLQLNMVVSIGVIRKFSYLMAIVRRVFLDHST